MGDPKAIVTDRMDSSDDTLFLTQLIGATALIENQANLDEALTALARATAELVGTDRCSVMLLSEPEADGAEPSLRVFAYFGDLPPEALREAVSVNKGIAGHVLAMRQSLLVPDVRHSPFAKRARFKDVGNPSLISAPIEVASRVVGVINVKGPTNGPPLTEKDLHLISLFAVVIGKSIQVFQLQKLAESRILQLAILRTQQTGTAGSALPRPIAPDPSRVVGLVATSLYRELTAAGFGPNDVIAVTTGVLNQLNESLKKGGPEPT